MMKAIIDDAVNAKGLNLETYGQKEEKLATNAVEVLVDHASINTISESMFELFQTS